MLLKSVERAFANDGEPPSAASAELPAANEEQPASNVAQPKPWQDLEAALQEDIIVLDNSNSGDPTPFIKSGIIQLIYKYSLVFFFVLSH